MIRFDPRKDLQDRVPPPAFKTRSIIILNFPFLCSKPSQNYIVYKGFEFQIILRYCAGLAGIFSSILQAGVIIENMPIVVQKYGGTSVGSTDRIKKVAERVIKTKQAGNDVVVIVSAMGHTTDELVSLLKQITSNPNPREYDMLLSTGEQVSAALVTSAIIELGEKAVSLTGGQAGVKIGRAHV